MKKQTQYTIYTENKDAASRSLIVKTVQKHFNAFTMQTGIGFWDDQRENSLQLTVITDRSKAQRHLLERIAGQIRDVNGQMCVRLAATKIKGKLI